MQRTAFASSRSALFGKSDLRTVAGKAQLPCGQQCEEYVRCELFKLVAKSSGVNFGSVAGWKCHSRKVSCAEAADGELLLWCHQWAPLGQV